MMTVDIREKRDSAAFAYDFMGGIGEERRSRTDPVGYQDTSGESDRERPILLLTSIDSRATLGS